MNRKNYLFCLMVILVFFLSINSNMWAQSVPPPLKNVKIQARVILDENGIYHYYHTVTNPAENKIGIGDVNIDITVPKYGNPPEQISVEGYTEPDRYDYALIQREGLLYISVAWKNTSLWEGGIRLEDDRYSLLGKAVSITWETQSDDNLENQYLLNPGQTSEELEMISYGLPGIRKVVFRPIWWVLNLPDEYLTAEEDSPKERIEKHRKKETLSYLGTTIGPTAPPAFTHLQFNQLLQEYISRCVTLGWLKDATLTQQ
ncbi:MAG TPA: hypothetical protein P5294_10555, partial [Smithellaceae bacterium]|nr:hypothetical protein [Smithellaceae bacterium]HRV26970.1 hypothetical protein [Smithellaceae bacterium]